MCNRSALAAAVQGRSVPAKAQASWGPSPSTAVADVGALLDNQAFRDGDRLDVRETSLDDGDCGVIEQLRDRGADVFTDLDC